jgi:hypothetical protein
MRCGGQRACKPAVGNWPKRVGGFGTRVQPGRHSSSITVRLLSTQDARKHSPIQCPVSENDQSWLNDFIGHEAVIYVRFV